MTRIVAIHGIGQQRLGAHTLKATWLPALQDGLARAGCKPIAEAEFTCAFYGDLFRPKGMKSIGDPNLDASDLDPNWEGTLLQLMVEKAGGLSAPVHEATKGLLSTPKGLQALVARALRLRFFGGLTETLLVLDLKQVRAYMRDDQVRAAIQDRVSSVLTHDTALLIGHSLGSVVAYEALCAHPDWSVRSLITLGSPLGIPSLIFDRLRPPPSARQGHFPPKIEAWTNVADIGDPVALVKDLSPCFGDQVRDLRVSNGATAHDVTPYLTARETGEAVAQGLIS
jgi:hypothetical protein